MFRKGKAGILTVDDDLKVVGDSGGKMTGLDVTGSIYLGLYMPFSYKFC